MFPKEIAHIKTPPIKCQGMGLLLIPQNKKMSRKLHSIDIFIISAELAFAAPLHFCVTEGTVLQ